MSSDLRRLLASDGVKRELVRRADEVRDRMGGLVDRPGMALRSAPAFPATADDRGEFAVPVSRFPHETHLLPVSPDTLTTTAPVDWPDTVCCGRSVATLMLIHRQALHLTSHPASAWCTYPQATG